MTLNGHEIPGEWFEWGYNGSGPGELAKAILTLEFDAEFSDANHQKFKRKCITWLPEQKWQLTSDEIRQYLELPVNP